MASFKLNIARIQGCPDPAELARRLEEFGLPESEEFGVLNHTATPETLFATIVRKTQTAMQRLDEEHAQITSAPVEKVTAYPFGLRPAGEVLEIYAGPVSGIEQVGVFFSSCLGLPTVVEPIEIDVIDSVRKLRELTKRFALASVRVSEYAHNSYMAGPYAPKFLDTEHGLEFMEEYADFLSSARVRFQGPSGRASVNLTPTSSFSFSCKEDDQPEVQSILRKLI